MFVPGKRTFTFECNVWGVCGVTGAMQKVLGAENEMIKFRLAEYVKNVLRGREKWGMKVRLTEVWAQLPKNQRTLRAAVAMPKATVAGGRSAGAVGE